MRTLLVMAGGTGGHVMPALSVAKALSARGVRIIWMGTQAGIEADLVPKAGFELRTLDVQGLRGTGMLRKILAPWTLCVAALQALRIILSSKADALLGMGGFASGPGGLVGALLGKPLIIHEQNAIAGTTNKLLARIARRRLSGFAQAGGIAGNQAIGNPIKSEFAAIAPPRTRLEAKSEQLRILVVGGSLGAQVFNERLPALLKTLADGLQLSVRHQTGKGKREAADLAYQQAGIEAQLSEFISDMPAAYSWADLVICRSGAMTVSEVAASGVAALFVPYPHAIDDHQWFNAQQLAQQGSALCYRQADFEAGLWRGEVKQLATDREQLIVMAEKARQHARFDATDELADICMEVLDA